MSPEKYEAMKERVAKMDPKVRMHNLMLGLLMDSLDDPEVSDDDVKSAFRQYMRYRQFRPSKAGEDQTTQPSRA